MNVVYVKQTELGATVRTETMTVTVKLESDNWWTVTRVCDDGWHSVDHHTRLEASLMASWWLS